LNEACDEDQQLRVEVDKLVVDQANSLLHDAEIQYELAIEALANGDRQTALEQMEAVPEVGPFFLRSKYFFARSSARRMKDDNWPIWRNNGESTHARSVAE
jgi:hypothetical protein